MDFELGFAATESGEQVFQCARGMSAAYFPVVTRPAARSSGLVSG